MLKISYDKSKVKIKIFNMADPVWSLTNRNFCINSTKRCISSFLKFLIMYLQSELRNQIWRSTIINFDYTYKTIYIYNFVFSAYKSL